MPDFYDVKNSGKGPMLFGSRSIGPGETATVYLTDEQHQKYSGLGWVVGVNSTVGNAYAIDGRYVSRSSVGSGTSGAGAGGVSDENIVFSDVNNDPTPGVWTELLPADNTRNGASIYNRSGDANLYIVASEDAPADGMQPGEFPVATLETYKFDFIPRKRYWMRSSVADSTVSLRVW